MKIQPYIEKLNASKEFKEFKKKYDDAFLIAGFFVIDLEMKKNIHQIDFYVPSIKKIAAFTLDENINLQLFDAVSDKAPEKLDIKTNIDLDALPGILEDEMKNRSITEDIKKIIAVIQNIKGRKVWDLNCVLSGMDILKAHVEDESKTVLKMEKTSFMDIVKKIPIQEIAAAENKTNPEEKIKKLEKLETEIKKEKQKLKKYAKNKENKD